MIDYIDLYHKQKGYFDLYGFRIKVTKYILDEYNIPGFETMIATPQNIDAINNIMISGYNQNRGIVNTARLLVDFLKGYESP